MVTKSSNDLDLFFLRCHGYSFVANFKKNSLMKVEHDKNDLACKIISQTKSIHIVPAHSLIQNEKFTFIFMQWIDEGNLLNYIKENGSTIFIRQENHAVKTKRFRPKWTKARHAIQEKLMFMLSGLFCSSCWIPRFHLLISSTSTLMDDESNRQ